jgi:hypothetical protein
VKRLYYLTDKADCVAAIADDIAHWDVGDWCFHVLNKDSDGLRRHQMHAAGPLHQRDVVHASERGALIGLAAGIGAVVASLLFLPILESSGQLAYVATVFLCTMFGAWSGGMFGLHEENHQIRRFHQDIESGKFLIMIDVGRKQVATVKSNMQRHAEALAAGEGVAVSGPLPKG